MLLRRRRRDAPDDPEAELVAETVRRHAGPVGANCIWTCRAHFANGYTVPLALERRQSDDGGGPSARVHILAPRNPFLRVASFISRRGSGKARMSTRIRLAKPQNVIAVAEMSDGALLMAKTWVEVEIDGCA